MNKFFLSKHLKTKINAIGEEEEFEVGRNFRCWIKPEKRMSYMNEVPPMNLEGDVDDFILMAQTDIEMKDEKPYEGDIIEVGSGEIGIVGWNRGKGKFYLYRSGGSGMDELCQFHTGKIIGNQFEDVNLLRI